MLKIVFLRNLFLSVLVLLLALVAYIHFAVFPAFNRLLVANTEDQAKRVATHLASMLLSEKQALSGASLERDPHFSGHMHELREELGLWKLRLFDPAGKVIFSTQPEEIGLQVSEPYFFQQVAQGQPWSKLEEKGGKSAEGEHLTLSIVETYIPLMRAGRFIGAFEVYYDVTQRAANLNQVIRQSAVVILLAFSGLLAALFFLLRRVARALGEREAASHTIEQLGLQRAQMLTALGEGVYGVDPAGRTTFINPAALRMLQLQEAQALGQSLHLLSHYRHADGGDYPECDCPIVHTTRDGATRHIDQDVFWRQDGSCFPVEYTCTPLRSGGNGFAGAVVVFRDISERRETERAQQAAAEAAEQASRAKSMFLANMSHEIRTPLNAVIGMGSLLEETPLDAGQREYVQTLRTSSESLLVLINDILDYSKIEAGHLELESQPFDLHECIDSALDLVSLHAAEKGLELVHDFNPALPRTLRGDITRLRQILVNLLGNAVKFTEHGQVVVRADLLAGEAGEHIEAGREVSLRFSVCDTGIGIPPEKIDRLFKSFSQIDASTTRRFGGSGLGLAISKRLSELMGGGMAVESAGLPGEGCCFSFTLRLPAARQALRSGEEECSRDLAGKCLLAVDDHPASLCLLERLAAQWGMRVAAFSSPLAALTAMDDGLCPDVAVFDRQMPEMDGECLARIVQTRLEARKLPCILLSSLGTPLDDAGRTLFASVLNKPLRFNALLQALFSVLTDESPRRGTCPSLPSGGWGGEAPSLRLLLVEDNPVNQRVAAHLLAKLGYKADLAGNGLEALAALARQAYDLVLMDVQMPEMDGLEATRRIVALYPSAQRPQIVAMTANAMQGDREACLEAGMNDYLAKPIRLDELQAALQRASARLEPLA
ncbi:MAG: response regulator [Azonexus sp.]|nr:response regulator [Azonexus sp.]MCK6412153.1 response regulator [Azonexus sp.]